MDSPSPEASPAKSVIEALNTLQEEFRLALQAYAARIDEDIARVQKAVLVEAAKKKTAPAKLRDLRDMLTVLRKSTIKAGKGKRKELKKIDSLMSDLTMLIEHW
ncbi:MAG: hypothetical protein ACREKL_07245 [Chthoniobacterales bacterium]